jgi:hypothetical protein
MRLEVALDEFKKIDRARKNLFIVSASEPIG